MATCGPLEVKSKSTDERRQQVMLGELPEDFLRVLPLTAEQQVSLDEQTAIALQHQYTVASAVSGRLTISIIEGGLLLRIIIVFPSTAQGGSKPSAEVSSKAAYFFALVCKFLHLYHFQI
ncbi:hypothetical protein CEXT_601241 [Caerostris extrusa]|uniref:Uncharacterized protein n=1 Tax=Caerostris extrusa TaxID=172846 RepID=A0AAV4TVL8_CAEEX|nr:hypothetical protein CEXT_601241 [Caerostris extrusa]